MIKTLLYFRNLLSISLLAFLFIISTGTISEIIGSNSEENDTLLGSYLAGRYATSQNDTGVAIRYYNSALKRDPKSDVLIKQSFNLNILEGRWEEAKKHANKLVAKEPKHHVARLFLGSMEFKKGKYKKAREQYSKIIRNPLPNLTRELAVAWSYAAEKKSSKGLNLLKEKTGLTWARFYRQYHRALMADMVGKYSIAAKEYKSLYKKNAPSRRVVLAYAHHLAAQKRYTSSAKILENYLKRIGQDVIVADLLKDIKQKKKIGPYIKSAEHGLARVLYGLGDGLRNEASSISLIFLQLSLHLDENFVLTQAALASIYERLNKYEEAISAYKLISKDTPIWSQAQIRMALNYNALDRVDDAKKLLDNLANEQPGEMRPLDALGNILLDHKRYKEAVTYYDRAIALIKKPKAENWSQYYSRGVCYERLGQWDKAEKDLQKALSLNKKQPLILNYLGYSWVDQNRNLKQAMDLIREAVRLKPNDGYFVDSLGWAHYRLGAFDKAVKYLERAVELKPDDPVINDHLGDAYWKVGRKLEAKYQWSQALGLKPEEKEIKKIKRKLKEGLLSKSEKNAAHVEKTDKKIIKK